MSDAKDQLDRDEEPFPRDEQDLTPPHGDELRSEVTFGRTDRYSNLDEEEAARTEQTPEKPAPPPATNTGETPGSANADVIGRGGDTIVQDRITLGRPVEGEQPDEVDRKAP